MQLLLVLLFICTANAKVFHFLNKLNSTIWVGCQGNTDKNNYTHPALENGGFKLPPNGTYIVTSPDFWAGRFWGRTGCNDTTNRCETGNCGDQVKCNGTGGAPPATLAEITQNETSLDYYDISLVDGFNIPISMEPLNGQNCKPSFCRYDINRECSPKLQVNSTSGAVIACKSACNAFPTDLYCCTNQYCCNNADKTCTMCKSTDWPDDEKNSAKFFKHKCPQAYSYACDDLRSTFTCKALGGYQITFGF